MKALRCFLILCIAVVSGTLHAQSQEELGQLMRNRGEYYFTLSVDNLTEIQAISKICSVDGTDGRTVVAYANQEEYEKLLQVGYRPELQTPPSMRANVTMWNGQGTYNWDSYLTYPQYVSMMEGFPSKAITGRTCTLFSLGTLTTSNHRELLGVRINNGSPEGKPKFLYSSTMHGDEVTGMILMLRLIDLLCTSTDDQVVNLVNSLDIYILPLTNPDGTYNGGNSTVNSAIRYNGYNRDLNRNYKDYFEGDHPDGYAYQDETLWTMAFADSLLFTMGGNYHGGAEVMNYPWDPVYTDHADKDWYEYTCTRYVQVARQTYSSYMTDTYSDGVTNGATWYTISGSRQDYMNAFGQCREVTVECSSVKTPAANQLPNYWNYNHYAMLAFMEEALYGVHGFVYDAVTYDALQDVTVTVENHDINNSYVTSHSIGDFHRPIKGGTYTFTFSKQGYYSQSVQVTVADGQRVDLEIYLQPNLNLSADFAASTTNVSLGQSISFTDTSEGMVTSWSWTFEGATPSTSTEQNPMGITYSTPGDYDVTLTVTGSTGNTQTVTKENYIHVAESINMQNGSVTTCSGIFYDSGGANSNYDNNLTYTMTFYPATEGAMMSVAFSQFNTESNYDYLYIYDGTSTSATQIGQYSGTTSPGTVTATNAAGALTFKFTSDSYQNASGWVANISCMTFERTISAAANPADGGTVEGAGIYTSGETCTLIATENEDYQFIKWTENGEVVSTDNPYSFTVSSDRTLVAVFASTEPIDITVSASPARGGSVSGGGEFLFGETCTVTAIANTGWAFDNWTENGILVSTEPTYSFEVEEERNLVANFSYEATISGDCYYTANSVSAGSYVMGYLDGSTLAVLSQSNSSVTTTSTTVTPTDYGFSVEEGTTLPQITLTANNGQYNISYNNRYLTASSSGGGYNSTYNLTWSNSTYNITKWNINGNSIYVTVSSGWNNNTYYLYFDTNTNSFKLSTSSQNNITFYAQGDCPVVPTYTIAATAEPTEGGTVDGADLYYQGETCTLIATANEGYNFINWMEDGVEVSTDAEYSFEVTNDRALVANFEEIPVMVEQTVALSAGWNWWSTNLNIDLAQLKSALEAAVGGATVMIKAQNGNFLTYANGTWRGTLTSLNITKMYKIQTSAACEMTLTGTIVDSEEYTITINPGNNWIGFPLSESISLDAAFGSFPVLGDMIKYKTGSSATYIGSMWRGNLNTLEPGQGYIYQSASEVNRTFTFGTNSK